MAKRDKAKKAVSLPGLLNDIMFKWPSERYAFVFGSTQSETVLRALLNALLDLRGPDRVVELAILSPSPEKFYFDDKGPILDLRARDEKGTHYHVEVPGTHRRWVKGTDLDYKKRSLYYTTRLYSEQLKSGHAYHLLERSLSISILDFVLFPHSTELHSTFTFWDRAQDFQLTKDLELHYIELPKFSPDKARQLRTRFERWLYVLKFSDLYHNRELPENLKEEEGIQMAIDAMRKAYAQDEIRAVIEAQERDKRDAISRLSFAERKGLQEGRTEALKVVLEARFQKLSPELNRKLESLSTEQFQLLLPLAATAETLDEFVAQMP